MAKTKMKPVLPSLNAALPIQLLRARESVMAWFRPHLRGHGLTDHQWRVLRALAEVESLEMQDLSRMCEVLPPSLSRIMPKMVEQGFVRRENDPSDQRRILASLTPAGRRLVEEVSQGSTAIYAALTRTIGADRLHELQVSLDEISSKLDQARRSDPAARAEEQTAALPIAAAPSDSTR